MADIPIPATPASGAVADDDLILTLRPPAGSPARPVSPAQLLTGLGALSRTEILALIARWAREGDGSTIPANKLALNGQVGQLVRITTGGALHWGFPGRLRAVGENSPAIAVSNPVFDDWYIQIIDSGEALRFWHRTGSEAASLWSTPADYRPKNLIAVWAQNPGGGTIPANRLGLEAHLLAITDAAAGRVLAINAAGDGVVWAVPSMGGSGLTQAQVDARIASWARTGNSANIPLGKLAAEDPDDGAIILSYGASENPEWTDGQTFVNGRVPTWARRTGATGFVPVQRIGSSRATAAPFNRYLKQIGATQAIWQDPAEDIQDIAAAMFSDVSEVSYDDGTGKLAINFPGGGSGLTEAQVRAIIQDWAEVGNALLIPPSKLHSTFTGNRLMVLANGAFHGLALGTANQVPAVNAAGNRLEFVDPGLTEAQVDTRVRVNVENFAEVNNDELVPAAKLATGGSDGQVLTLTNGSPAWEDAGTGTGTSSAQVQLYNESSLQPNRTGSDIIASLSIPNMEVGERVHFYAVWQVTTPRTGGTDGVGAHWISVSNAGVLSDDAGGVLTGERNLAQGLPANALDAPDSRARTGPTTSPSRAGITRSTCTGSRQGRTTKTPYTG